MMENFNLEDRPNVNYSKSGEEKGFPVKLEIITWGRESR